MHHLTPPGYIHVASMVSSNRSPRLCPVFSLSLPSPRYRKLAHDKFRGIRDPSLKPNKEERERIEAIVASPSDHLRVEDKDLLWTFQFSLTDNKKALTKFLLSVDWSVEQVRAEGHKAAYNEQAGALCSTRSLEADWSLRDAHYRPAHHRSSWLTSY